MTRSYFDHVSGSPSFWEPRPCDVVDFVPQNALPANSQLYLGRQDTAHVSGTTDVRVQDGADVKRHTEAL